ncbi:hypothetical protein [Kitasatospora purpeofusca]|uniref:Ig-like domain-containing protein n=1 Tax=Kitasatospora purpeofusca TaxID=67352 RepID=A0ABZ1UAK3_9ACTN|nr:hypothetical protein [Kitasatospora purpeofusca]
MSRSKSLTIRAIAVAGLAAGVWLPAAPQASAAPTIDAACPVGAATVNYSPGVTLSPHQTDLTFTGSAAPCTSSDPSVTAATFTGSGSGQLGCVSGAFDATGLVTWNTGATSSVTFSSVVDLRPSGIPVVVANGPVTSGKFRGDAVTLTIELIPANPLACLTTGGVTQTHGAATILMSHL